MTRSLSLAALTIAALGFTAAAHAQNHVVGGTSSISRRYDPFTDTHYVETNRETVRESALDWDRNYVDPGSYRYVDRIVTDQYGRRVREYGYVWTTNGKPHGRLTRDSITVTRRDDFRPDVRRRDRDTVVFAPNPGGNPVTIQRDRDVVNFNVGRVNPGNVVQRDQETVNFTPNVVQRDRETATFFQAPGNVQRDQTTVNFGPRVIQRDRNITNFHQSPGNFPGSH